MAEFEATVIRVTRAMRKKDSVIYDRLRVVLDDGATLDIDAVDCPPIVGTGVRVGFQPTKDGMHWILT